MWHKNPECCYGQTFWVDPPGFDNFKLFSDLLNSVFVKQQPIFEHMKTHIRSNYLCSPRGPTSQIGLKSMPEPVV